jgi:putative polyhydroxyalkanoate system protein
MAHIRITSASPVASQGEEAADATSDEDLNERFGLAYEWSGDCIDFRRAGLDGKLHVLKDQVRLDCELGFVMSVFKPKFEAAIHVEFDKYFGKSKT